MIDILSSEGLAVLRELKHTKTLFAFDYDGTLAALTSVPSEAHLAASTEALLLRLQEKHRVAIISGRAREDVLNFFDRSPEIVIGNHGLEHPQADPVVLQRWHNDCDAWAQELKHAYASAVAAGQLRLEHKAFSLTLHSGDAALHKAMTTWAAEKSLPAMRILVGKNTVNLIPQDAGNKGAALIALLERLDCERALFVGDDVTDEDVFALKDPRIVGVRVGRGAESHAEYFLEHQRLMDRLLEFILEDDRQ